MDLEASQTRQERARERAVSVELLPGELPTGLGFFLWALKPATLEAVAGRSNGPALTQKRRAAQSRQVRAPRGGAEADLRHSEGGTLSMLRCLSAARVAASELRALFAAPSAEPAFVQVHSDVSTSSWPIVPARVVHTCEHH